MALKRNSELRPTTICFISLPSPTANQRISRNSLTLTYPGINKSKYKRHPRYIISNETF